MEIAVVKFIFWWIFFSFSSCKGLYLSAFGDSQYLLFDSEIFYLLYDFSFDAIPDGLKGIQHCEININKYDMIQWIIQLIINSINSK